VKGTRRTTSQKRPGKAGALKPAQPRSDENEQEQPPGPRRRASRSTKLPTLLASASVPYANKSPGLRGLSAAEKVVILMGSDAYRRIVLPVLAEVDAERLARPGPDPAYESRELEGAVLYQLMSGKRTYAKARERLAGDRTARERRLLRFDLSRRRFGRNKQVIKSRPGVPSESTIWNYLQDFGLARRVRTYRKLFHALVAEHLLDPEFLEEARVMFVDGSAWRSHYTSFTRKDRETGEVKPPTLEGGGYMARSKSNHGKDGHGFMPVTGTTQTGMPLTYIMGRLGKDSEKTLASRLMHTEWTKHVAPHLGRQLGLWVADGGFWKPRLFRALRKMGQVEVCHHTSHAETSKSQANKQDEVVIEIAGYPNWYANGHRELKCRCGQATLTRRLSVHECTGELVARVEGNCESCGSITITSGKWRKAKNPSRFVHVEAGEEHTTDLAFGNPFSFHDALTEKYGGARFPYNEGFYAHMCTRFGIPPTGKSWHRSRASAEHDLVIVFCFMHTLAMESKRRMRERDAAIRADDVGPPGLALAA